MYRAIYAFKSDSPNALTFDVGERFTVIDNTKDSHWWLVQNDREENGFVPANYIKQDEVARNHGTYAESGPTQFHDFRNSF